MTKSILYRMNLYGMNLYLIAAVATVAIIFFIFFIISYINRQRSIMPSKQPLKIVVFDLDETLGYFTELGIFWDALEKFYGHNLFSDKFIEVMDTFPEFFRPNILNIIDFIHSKKTCHKIILYTNNQGPKSWVKMISEYFNHKLGYEVFDRLICAYKVNGRQIEPKRTSHDKSTKDLFSILDMPPTTEVCFVDDLYHPLMDKENVSYINIKPYRDSLPFDEMAARYYNNVMYNSSISNTTSELKFVNFIVSYMNQYNYMVVKKSKEEEKTDIIVSKKLLSHLADFLKPERKNVLTRKKRLRRIKSMRQMPMK
jgi:hypothetical protein